VTIFFFIHKSQFQLAHFNIIVDYIVKGELGVKGEKSHQLGRYLHHVKKKNLETVFNYPLFVQLPLIKPSLP